MADTRNELVIALHDVPNFDDEPALAYDAMIALAGWIIDMADAECRDLTDWERANLAQAISSLAIGWLRIAWVDLELALAPPEDVAPRPVAADYAAMLKEQLSNVALRDDLAHLALHPPRRIC